MVYDLRKFANEIYQPTAHMHTHPTGIHANGRKLNQMIMSRKPWFVENVFQHIIPKYKKRNGSFLQVWRRMKMYKIKSADHVQHQKLWFRLSSNQVFRVDWPIAPFWSLRLGWTFLGCTHAIDQRAILKAFKLAVMIGYVMNNYRVGAVGVAVAMLRAWFCPMLPRANHLWLCVSLSLSSFPFLSRQLLGNPSRCVCVWTYVRHDVHETDNAWKYAMHVIKSHIH